MVPALQFELASIEHGPEFGMPQKVIDGHKETLEGGAESARRILKAGGRLGMGGDYGFAWNPRPRDTTRLSCCLGRLAARPTPTPRAAPRPGARSAGPTRTSKA